MQKIESIPKLPPRPKDSHKGMFGRICIIAGSLGMTGAAALTGRAALRAGAGLVRIATPKSALPIVASIDPCYTTIPLEEDSGGRISLKALKSILKAAEENDILAIGPGMGISRDLQTIILDLIQKQNLTLVIDADGLSNLAKIAGWHKKAKAQIILTPHPGEMQRLWKSLSRDVLPGDRIQQAAIFAEQTATVTVLKGADTVVADRDRFYVNTTGNPGMAAAGSGDCLTGIIAALLGQKMSPFNAAQLAVYVHGLAGDIAAEKKGQISLIATDIIDSLPEAFMNMNR